MDKTIKVEVKEVYGRTLIYPVNDEAKYFTALTKKKTLDSTDLSFIEKLGFIIEQVTRDLKTL